MKDKRLKALIDIITASDEQIEAASKPDVSQERWGTWKKVHSHYKNNDLWVGNEGSCPHCKPSPIKGKPHDHSKCGFKACPPYTSPQPQSEAWEKDCPLCRDHDRTQTFIPCTTHGCNHCKYARQSYQKEIVGKIKKLKYVHQTTNRNIDQVAYNFHNIGIDKVIAILEQEKDV